MTILIKHFNIRAILTNEVHNQKLFQNFDTLRNRYNYSLHMTKMTITANYYTPQKQKKVIV
jgi:hypothetical protein